MNALKRTSGQIRPPLEPWSNGRYQRSWSQPQSRGTARLSAASGYGARHWPPGGYGLRAPCSDWRGGPPLGGSLIEERAIFGDDRRPGAKRVVVGEFVGAIVLAAQCRGFGVVGSGIRDIGHAGAKRARKSRGS